MMPRAAVSSVPAKEAAAWATSRSVTRASPRGGLGDDVVKQEKQLVLPSLSADRWHQHRHVRLLLTPDAGGQVVP
jgi:hypothetical protein